MFHTVKVDKILAAIDWLQSTLSWYIFKTHCDHKVHIFISGPIEPYILKLAFILRRN